MSDPKYKALNNDLIYCNLFCLTGNSEAASEQANASNKPLPNLVPLSTPSGTPGVTAGINSGKKFRCKLCNVLVTFESNAIKLHLKNYHNLSINEYQPLVRKMAVGSVAGASTINNKPSPVESSAGVGQHFLSNLLTRTPEQKTSASPPLLKKMLMSPQTSKGK